MCKTCNVEYIAEKVKLDINKTEVVSGCRLRISVVFSYFIICDVVVCRFGLTSL